MREIQVKWLQSQVCVEGGIGHSRDRGSGWLSDIYNIMTGKVGFIEYNHSNRQLPI